MKQEASNPAKPLYVAQYEPDSALEGLGEILDAIQILTHSLHIGRPVKGRKRELRIGCASGAYVALYPYVQAIDNVTVLAVRSQR